MKNRFDTFLSYNSRDKTTVRRLANGLKKLGLHVWLDEQELAPGGAWWAELKELIEDVPSVIVPVGSNGIAHWQDAELRASLKQWAARGIPIIPVLLPSAPIDYKLPPSLRKFTSVDCRDGLSERNLDLITWGVTGKKLRGSKRAKRVSAQGVGLEVESTLTMRRGRVPYRVVTEGTEGYEHYPLRINLSGPASVLDCVLEVEYQLHEAFKRPRRVTTDRPSKYAIEIWAYGGFEMSAKAQLEGRRIVVMRHKVKLRLPDDDGTNYVKERSKIGESTFEGCDAPE